MTDDRDLNLDRDYPDPRELHEDQRAQEATEADEREARDRALIEEVWPSLAETHAPVAIVAAAATEELTAADLERFVIELDLPRIPPTVIRLRAIAAAASKLAERLESRWGQETGGLGWKDPGSERAWTYRGTSSKGWDDIPGLVADLLEEGIGPRSIAEAISEIRVTDLRAAAERIPALERKKRVLELIEEHRKRHYGTPHFSELED